MFRNRTQASAFYLSCAAIGFGMLGIAPPARAEKSIKKLEHKLHKVEKGTGKVLEFAGKAALIGAEVGLEMILNSLDDDPQDRGDFRTRHRPIATHTESTQPNSSGSKPK